MSQTIETRTVVAAGRKPLYRDNAEKLTRGAETTFALVTEETTTGRVEWCVGFVSATGVRIVHRSRTEAAGRKQFDHYCRKYQS